MSEDSKIIEITGDTIMTTPTDRVRAALELASKHMHGFPLIDETLSELDGMVLVPVGLSDEAYEEAVAKTRRSLELGMTFGDDPIEQIVHIVHQAVIAPYVEGE